MYGYRSNTPEDIRLYRRRDEVRLEIEVSVVENPWGLERLNWQLGDMRGPDDLTGIGSAYAALGTAETDECVEFRRGPVRPGEGWTVVWREERAACLAELHRSAMLIDQLLDGE
jgi:hypothetical protein